MYIKHKVLKQFECNGEKMVIVKMSNSAHVMPLVEWKRTYGKLHYDRWKNKY